MTLDDINEDEQRKDCDDDDDDEEDIVIGRDISKSIRLATPTTVQLSFDLHFQCEFHRV